MSCLGGFSPGGFWQGGFCPGGFCPGVYVRGVFVWGVFVLEPTGIGFYMCGKIADILATGKALSVNFILSLIKKHQNLKQYFKD